MMQTVLFCAGVALAATSAGGQPTGKLDTSKTDAAIGAQGAMIEPEGVYKVTFPRADVPIVVDDRKMEPFMGFTSWSAFQAGKNAGAMVMGDLVLFPDEVNSVMSAALESGLQVTALHNHFFFDDPKVYFMHIGGEGAVEQLARGVRKTLDAVKQVWDGHAAPPCPAGIGSRAAWGAAARRLSSACCNAAIGRRGRSGFAR